MVTLADRLTALLCPYGDDGAQVDPPWIWGLVMDHDDSSDWTVAVTYDPALREHPFVLVARGDQWELTFAPDGAIDRARHGDLWVLDPAAKEALWNEMVARIQQVHLE